MPTATISSNGQITIPAEVRRALQIDTGERVEFVEVEPERYEFFAATRPVTDLKGLFGMATKRVSIDAMDTAIARLGTSAR